LYLTANEWVASASIDPIILILITRRFQVGSKSIMLQRRR